MRTERQIQASRANGARSRGPVTAEGKRNSFRNAVKHGWLAETIVLKSELSDRFLEIIAELEDELQPETSIEYTLIQKMAAARWRQLRLWGMEKAAMEQQIRRETESGARGEDIPTRASMAFRSLGEARSLDLIIRYDSLCDRQYLRAHRRFMEMRRDDGESPAPLKSRSGATRRAEVVPIREVPHPEDVTPEPAGESFVSEPNEPEPNEPEPHRPAPDRPEPFEQSHKKRTNEPENVLKTKSDLETNPAISAGTRPAARRTYARLRPQARRYWSKRDSRKRLAARLLNMSRPHIKVSRPKPGPVGRN
jgi:hypothetical protein